MLSYGAVFTLKANIIHPIHLKMPQGFMDGYQNNQKHSLNLIILVHNYIIWFDMPFILRILFDKLEL